MSYIQFESAREKDKARQELREVREQMLKEAKKRAEDKADYDVKRALKGETNWMLPSVERKFEAKIKEIKKSKKKKDKKGSKKNKKGSSKKRKYSSSGTDSDSTSSSSEEEKKRHKKSKKSKKSEKLKNSSSSNNEETKNEKERYENITEHVEPLTRDSWMTSPLMLKTYAKEKKELKLNENKHSDTYDPTKNSREMNPYWKITGTGLPSFLKPKDSDDYETQPKKSEKPSFSVTKSSSRAWKKPTAYESPQRRQQKSTAPSDETMSSSEDDNGNNETKSSDVSKAQFLTDQQMNELGAKALKAELMGNKSLAEELRQKMENARAQRNAFKDIQKQSKFVDQLISDKRVVKTEEHIILTHTDKLGCTRPLPVSKVMDSRDKKNQRQKSKPMKTHNEYGERVRYFADDDRYNIKEMFEKEKLTSASDANLQFVTIASKHKNPNDDMEDIFAEKICKDDSARADQKERNRAIREHQNTEKVLDNCDKCFESTKIHKEHLVCVGEKVYLALPWYQGLQEGHCMIIPNQHVSCCTQVDEDTWIEINEFRNALTRMFTAQGKDVIFFEIANRLYKRPHLVIHCIPIRESDGEMAPFYFKKAIEESEHDWSINKQLVSLRNKSLISCIPKGLPYFWVNFGMDTGFAHVIEDEERFPVNFAQEIIGGMLNLDARKWRNLKKEQNVITKVKTFAEFWKTYDCTT